jgi:hypothetical protein
MSALSTNSAANNPAVSGLSNVSSTLGSVLSSSTRVIAPSNNRAPNTDGANKWPAAAATQQPVMNVLDFRDFASLGCNTGVLLPSDPQNEGLQAATPAIQNNARVFDGGNVIAFAGPQRTTGGNDIAYSNDNISLTTDFNENAAAGGIGWRGNLTYKDGADVASGFAEIPYGAAAPDVGTLAELKWNTAVSTFSTGGDTDPTKYYRVAQPTLEALRPSLMNGQVSELYVAPDQAGNGQQFAEVTSNQTLNNATVTNFNVGAAAVQNMLGRAWMGTLVQAGGTTQTCFRIVGPAVAGADITVRIDDGVNVVDVTLIGNGQLTSLAGNIQDLLAAVQALQNGTSFYFIGPASAPDLANTSDQAVAPVVANYVTIRKAVAGQVDGVPVKFTFTNTSTAFDRLRLVTGDVRYQLFEDQSTDKPARVAAGVAPVITNFTLLGDANNATPILLSFGPDTQQNALSLHNEIFGSSWSVDEEKSTLLTIHCLDGEPDVDVYVGTADETALGSGLYTAGRPQVEGNFVTFSRNLQDALDTSATLAPSTAGATTFQMPRAQAVQVTSSVQGTKFSIKLLARWIPKSGLTVNGIPKQANYSINFSVVDRETTADTTKAP